MSTNGFGVLLAAILVAILLFVAVILGTILGAFTGWILSLTFLGDWIIAGFKVFGINAEGKLVVLGAMLGFLSGFFKTSVSKGD